MSLQFPPARRARAHGAIAPLGSTKLGVRIIIVPLDPTASVQARADVVIWPLHPPRDLCTRFLRGLVCSAINVALFRFGVAPVTLVTKVFEHVVGGRVQLTDVALRTRDALRHVSHALDGADAPLGARQAQIFERVGVEGVPFPFGA